MFGGSATAAGVVAVAVTVGRGERDVEAKIIIDGDAVEIERVRVFLAEPLGPGVDLLRR